MTGMADAYGLTDWFAARGVSKDQAHACLAKTDELQKIAEQTQKWSTDDGINQTPTIFINGAKTDIATWKDLEPALQNAGAR
jgi:protein-disulfide isomerase